MRITVWMRVEEEHKHNCEDEVKDDEYQEELEHEDED